jgi:hypothetical protein
LKIKSHIKDFYNDTYSYIITQHSKLSGTFSLDAQIIIKGSPNNLLIKEKVIDMKLVVLYFVYVLSTRIRPILH